MLAGCFPCFYWNSKMVKSCFIFQFNSVIQLILSFDVIHCYTRFHFTIRRITLNLIKYCCRFIVCLEFNYITLNFPMRATFDISKSYRNISVVQKLDEPINTVGIPVTSKLHSVLYLSCYKELYCLQENIIP